MSTFLCNSPSTPHLLQFSIHIIRYSAHQCQVLVRTVAIGSSAKYPNTGISNQQITKKAFPASSQAPQEPQLLAPRSTHQVRIHEGTQPTSGFEPNNTRPRRPQPQVPVHLSRIQIATSKISTNKTPRKSPPSERMVPSQIPDAHIGPPWLLTSRLERGHIPKTVSLLETDIVYWAYIQDSEA